ncbi:hypothetical protein PMIN06_001984 [Paraphaeosphaeria minitans]|uniref:Holocytochrome c-type synthase n=1 Tax=Paraphaeosphaeria minitans TaxID=565426 RepID=A0A9P6GMU6_9PLEO|nr:cytochrome c/c1 heme lyase [Paraphaeosphaeria minitans]
MAAQDSPDACPVDHKTREAWLAQAKKAKPNATVPPTLPHAAAAATTTPGCDSSAMEASQSTHPPNSVDPIRRLGIQREISTIPRALPNDDAPASARPANSEKDTGADKKTGNWIYPSEQMFFEAMKRKAFNPDEMDMHTIVPIHNAVNERAWKEIKEWEKGRGSEACGGPKLASFSGLSSSLTPRARLNTMMGYKPPFDRHDWVVDRCGTKVEYVIDFYAGKDEERAGKGLNFFLDVRPKLNSWEGVKLRAFKFVGL